MTISVLSASTLSIAATTCDDVIAACDKALEDKQKQVDTRDLALREQKDQLRYLSEELADKDSWTHSPWLYFGLGIVAAKVLSK